MIQGLCECDAPLADGGALIGGGLGHGPGAVAGEMISKRIGAKVKAANDPSVKMVRLSDVKNPPRAPAPKPKRTVAERAQSAATNTVTNAPRVLTNPLALYGPSGAAGGEGGKK
jgi:hypothetical protein